MKKLSPLFAVVLFLALMLPARAQQSEFVDPVRQLTSAPGAYNSAYPEHWVYNNLYLYAFFAQNNGFTWNSPSGLYNDASSAMARWNSPIASGVDPSVYTSDANAANLTFVEQVCPNLTPACADVQQWNSISNWNVNLWTKARIWIQPNGYKASPLALSQYWTPEGRRGTLTHEAGHVWGLGDRYNNNGSCNNNEFTVMDTIKSQILDSAIYWSPCDTEFRQSIDNIRFQYYYIGGGYDFESYINAPTYRTAQWKDASWMDWSYRSFFYTGPGPGGPWTYYAVSDGSTVNNGSHRFVSDASSRVLQNTIYPTNVHGQYMLACSRGDVDNVPNYTEWRCAPFAAYRP